MVRMPVLFFMGGSVRGLPGEVKRPGVTGRHSVPRLSLPSFNRTEIFMLSAPAWRRIAAIAYDSVVILAIWMLVGFMVAWAFGIEGNVEVEEGHVALASLYRYTLFSAMMVSAYLFFAWFWTHSGQTIGMMAWKIRIVNTDGSAISYLQSLKRCAAGALSLACFGLGHWWALFDKDGDSLIDRFSDSRVISTPR